jgi:hypothetical protein
MGFEANNTLGMNVVVTGAPQSAAEVEKFNAAVQNTGKAAATASSGGLANFGKGIVGLGFTLSACNALLEPVWQGLGKLAGNALKAVGEVTGMTNALKSLTVALGIARSEEDQLREAMDKLRTSALQDFNAFEAQWKALDRTATQTRELANETNQLRLAEEQRRAATQRNAGERQAAGETQTAEKLAAIDQQVASGALSSQQGERDKAALSRTAKNMEAVNAIGTAKEEAANIRSTIEERQQAQQLEAQRKERLGDEADKERAALESTRAQKLNYDKELERLKIEGKDKDNVGNETEAHRTVREESERAGEDFKQREKSLAQKHQEIIDIDNKMASLANEITALEGALKDAESKVKQAEAKNAAVLAENKGEVAREATSDKETGYRGGKEVAGIVNKALNTFTAGINQLDKTFKAQALGDLKKEARAAIADEKKESKAQGNVESALESERAKFRKKFGHGDRATGVQSEIEEKVRKRFEGEKDVTESDVRRAYEEESANYIEPGDKKRGRADRLRGRARGSGEAQSDRNASPLDEYQAENARRKNSSGAVAGGGVDTGGAAQATQEQKQATQALTAAVTANATQSTALMQAATAALNAATAKLNMLNRNQQSAS